METKQEKEREIQRVQDARVYYQKHLLRKYILGTFQKLIEIKRSKEEEADSFRSFSIKRHGLQKLRTATQIQMYEREKLEQKQMDHASAFWEYNLLLKVLKCIR